MGLSGVIIRRPTATDAASIPKTTFVDKRGELKELEERVESANKELTKEFPDVKFSVLNIKNTVSYYVEVNGNIPTNKKDDFLKLTDDLQQRYFPDNFWPFIILQPDSNDINKTSVISYTY